jgi:hypothetical protein
MKIEKPSTPEQRIADMRVDFVEYMRARDYGTAFESVLYAVRAQNELLEQCAKADNVWSYDPEFGKFREDAKPPKIVEVSTPTLREFPNRSDSPNNETNRYIDQLLSVCKDNDIEIGNLREEINHLKDLSEADNTRHFNERNMLRKQVDHLNSVICEWQRWYDYYSKLSTEFDADFPEAPGMQHVYKPTPCGGPGEPPCKGINEERYGNTKLNNEKGE